MVHVLHARRVGLGCLEEQYLDRPMPLTKTKTRHNSDSLTRNKEQELDALPLIHVGLSSLSVCG